jgi:NADP-dependent 3-hydroxy acid dehydrogenase YdfG
VNSDRIAPWFLGKTVVVVGGTGSIGAAVARYLGEGGANAIVAAQDVIEDEQPAPTSRFHVDISVEKSVVSFFGLLDDLGVQVNALVNAAGVGIFKRTDQITAADWEYVMNSNAAGVFYCFREVLKRMPVLGGGRIVSIGSISTEVALPQNALYAASKACVKTMSRSINEEFKDMNIRSSVIHLGAVSSRVWDSRPEFDRASMLSPMDVAGTVAYILSLPLNVRLDEVTIMPSKGIV